MKTKKNKFINNEKDKIDFLNAIFQNTIDGILVADEDKNFVMCNKTICKMLGYTEKELMTKNIKDIHPKDSLDYVAEQFKKQIQKKIKIAHELPVLKKDSSVFFTDVGSYPIKIDDKNYLVGYFRDVNERRNLVEKLKITQFSIDQSADPTYWIDSMGQVTYANKAACVSLEYSEKQLLSMKLFDIDPNIKKKDWQEYWEIIKKDGFLRIESQNIRKNGKTFPVDVMFNFVSFEGEEYCCTFIRDITQHKEAEKILMNSHDYLEQKVKERTIELEKSNEELKEITAQLVQSGKLAALGELTAGIAHELNQPLNGIKITSQSLQMDIKKERLEIDKLNKKLGTIVSQVDKMSEIINHMRIFTRQTYGSNYIKSNVFEIINDAFTFIKQQLLNNNISINIDTEKKPIYITVDPVAIEQVLLNLLSNARHALNKSQKEKKELEVKIKDEKNNIILSIQDNGDGIPKNEIDKIFNPFFTTKEPGEGTGLGLSVTHKIINEHNGTITVNSELGKYTRFEISLPKNEETSGGN